MPIPRDSVPHKLTDGTKNYSVELPDIYSSIGTLVGITKLAGETDLDAGGSPSDMVGLGKALKIRVRYLEGTRYAYTDVLCAASKAGAAVNALKGKTLHTGATIKSSFFPRRRRLV